jgi:rhamnose utilization protein RhaD (predicted bifunctional aldolase and dehydrogenase)/NAD(P)-dependent dehydrogenase (short-subunit alcohol dehydrogenase family)
MSELQKLVERSKKLGADQNLVVYGGGNTSAKGEIKDYLGRNRTVLWVKGSGADMQYGEAVDYPALYLEELIALNKMNELDDETMVDYVTRALVDPTARRPSIETLLHAFLPARHIDHVHADVICALTNHEDGRSAVREALGEGFAYVDWIRPGFQLSKSVGELKDYEGVVLAHHGLIVWDDDSNKCYEKNLVAVAKAKKYLDSLKNPPKAEFKHQDLSEFEIRELLLKLRGKLGKRQILRTDTRLRSVADRPDLPKVIAAGSSSADHMLRIRPWSCATTLNTVEESVTSYQKRYGDYFEANRSLLPPGYVSHGNDPRVFLVPGLGAITAATTVSETKMLADIAFHTHSVAALVADSFAKPRALPDSEIFGFDYWPMELYKLKLKPKPALLAGAIYVVTGAGSGIGRGIALYLASLGANLTLADLDKAGLDKTASEIRERKFSEPHLIVGDQSDELKVQETIASTISNFGGLDGLVLNAGIPVAGTLEELSIDSWRKGLEVNLTSAFLLTKYGMKAMRTQGMGGSLVYIASKNAFAPGAGFGGYSVSKSGMIQLMRIAALEGGAAGIRANALNPDAIFDNSKLWEGGVREQRAKEHGVKPEELEDFYAKRNLLKVHVRSEDVARSVAYLLSDESSRTTGSVIPVDGGVAGGFPR